jgi:hypothetical protein
LRSAVECWYRRAATYDEWPIVDTNSRNVTLGLRAKIVAAW